MRVKSWAGLKRSRRAASSAVWAGALAILATLAVLPRPAYAAAGDVVRFTLLPAEARCPGPSVFGGTSLGSIPGSRVGMPDRDLLLVTSCTRGSTQDRLFFTDPAADPPEFVGALDLVECEGSRCTPTPFAGAFSSLALRPDHSDFIGCDDPDSGSPSIYQIDLPPDISERQPGRSVIRGRCTCDTFNDCLHTDGSIGGVCDVGGGDCDNSNGHVSEDFGGAPPAVIHCRRDSDCASGHTCQFRQATTRKLFDGGGGDFNPCTGLAWDMDNEESYQLENTGNPLDVKLDLFKTDNRGNTTTLQLPSTSPDTHGCAGLAIGGTFGNRLLALCHRIVNTTLEASFVRVLNKGSATQVTALPISQAMPTTGNDIECGHSFLETTQVVDIINGRFDLDRDGSTNSPGDSQDNVVFDLTFGDRIEFIDGLADLNEDGVIDSKDTREDLRYFDNSSDPVDVNFVEGSVDVNQNGILNEPLIDGVPNTGDNHFLSTVPFAFEDSGAFFVITDHVREGRFFGSDANDPANSSGNNFARGTPGDAVLNVIDGQVNATDDSTGVINASDTTFPRIVVPLEAGGTREFRVREGQIDLDGTPEGVDPNDSLTGVVLSVRKAIDLLWIRTDSNLFGVELEPGTCRIGNGSLDDSISGRCIPDPNDPFVDPPRTDRDGDGLLDCWEEDGIDGDNDGDADLILVGANPSRKNLYVEIDYQEKHRPNDEAVSRVVQAFANAPVGNPNGTSGIDLRFEIDEKVAPESQSCTIQSGDPNCAVTWRKNQIPDAPYNFDELKKSFFGSAAQRPDPAVLEAKRLAYRYGIFAHQFQSSKVCADPNNPNDPNSQTRSQCFTDSDCTEGHKFETSTVCATAKPKVCCNGGVAEFEGNDFMVAIWKHGKLSEYSIDSQASTLMHELGHALGLKHGGGDNTNCKPNYLSIMNYARGSQNCGFDRPLDFSACTLPTLDENDLDERDGIGVTNDPFGCQATETEESTIYHATNARCSGSPDTLCAEDSECPQGRCLNFGDPIGFRCAPSEATPNLSQACTKDEDCDGPAHEPCDLNKRTCSLTPAEKCTDHLDCPVIGGQTCDFMDHVVPAQGAIDWDFDGSASGSSVTVDVNFTRCGGCDPRDGSSTQRLKGYNDWAQLKYSFRESKDFQDGARLSIDPAELDFTEIAENWPDEDLDGVADLFDNCLDLFNPGQEDLDLDGQGDLCDADNGSYIAGLSWGRLRLQQKKVDRGRISAFGFLDATLTPNFADTILGGGVTLIVYKGDGTEVVRIPVEAAGCFVQKGSVRCRSLDRTTKISFKATKAPLFFRVHIKAKDLNFVVPALGDLPLFGEIATPDGFSRNDAISACRQSKPHLIRCRERF